MSRKRITPQQEDFARHYVACRNATRAAILAGYSEKTAYQSGHRLLKSVEIQELIRSIRESDLAVFDTDRREVLRLLIRIAFGDVRELVEWDENGRPKVVPSKQVSDDAAAMIAGMTFDSETRMTPDGAEIRNDRLTIKFSDKLRAAKLIGDHLQMWGPDGQDGAGAGPPTPPLPAEYVVEDMSKPPGAPDGE